MNNLGTMLNLISGQAATALLVLQAIMVGTIALSCLVMIVMILVSPPQTGIGNNPITGATESYYTKNKGKNNQGRVKWTIIICAAIIAFCAIMYFILYGIYRGQ